MHRQLGKKKSLFTVFWDEKGVILVNFMCRVPTVISDCYNDTTNRTNVFAFIKFIPDEQRSVIPPWQCLAVHECTYNTDHHKFWMDRVSTSTLQSWHRSIRLSPLRYIKTSPQKHCYADDGSCGNASRGRRGGRPTYSRLEYILLFKGTQRLSVVMGTTLQNNYAFSNVVVKFCETIVCPTYKHSFTQSIGICRMRWFLAVLPFLSVMYFSYHPSPPTILPFSLTSSCHLFLDLPLNLVVPKFTYNTLLGILFPSILCTCPNQHNLFNHTISNIVGFFTLA